MGRTFLIILSFCITMVSQSICQTSTYAIGDQVIVETSDGSSIIGEIMNRESSGIRLLSISLGEINIDYEQIRRIQVLKYSPTGIDKHAIPLDFHNSTHYILSPSAYGLKKGQSYYENIAIFWNSYTYGISDNFSVSVGGEILSLLLASNFPIIFVTPKFSVPLKNEAGAFSIASTVFTTPESHFRTFGFVTSSLTLGNRNSNVTLGTGIGFSSEDGFENEIIPFTISGMFRLGPKLSILTENWLIAENGFSDMLGVLSAGLRIHFKNPGSAFNAGLWRPTEGIGNVIGIPFVSVTIGLK